VISDIGQQSLNGLEAIGASRLECSNDIKATLSTTNAEIEAFKSEALLHI